MPNKRYVPSSGQWKLAKQNHVGVSGAWVPQRVRFVADKGLWIETNTDEVETNPLLGIDSFKYRAGGPLQGDLEIKGYGLSNTFLTVPATGAFYMLRKNFSDEFENFSSLSWSGTEIPLLTIEDGLGAYQLDPSKQQYFYTDGSDESSFDLRGFLAGGIPAGDTTWELGGKFKPKVMPELDGVSIVWYSEVDAEQYIRIWFDSSGTLYFRYQYSLTTAYEMSLSEAVADDEWTGFSVRQRIDPDTAARHMTLQIQDGRTADLEGPFTYFTPPSGHDIELGSGMSAPSITPTNDWFRSENTAPAFTIVTDTNLYWTGTAYRSSVPSNYMNPNTGKYYIEILNKTSYDIHFGVSDQAFNLTGDNILYSWVINTINGRIFAHQAGGGTNWTSAIPDNAVIGLVYDSDLGTLEVFVNGTTRGKPWNNGTITVPVQFTVAGRGQNATGPVRPFDVSVRTKSGDWTNKPSGTFLEMPYQDEAIPGARVYSDIVLRDFYLRRDNDGEMSDDRRALVLDPNPILNILFYPEDGGSPIETNQYILVSTPDGSRIVMATPELDDGNYYVRVSYSTIDGESSPRLFTVRNQVMRTEPLHIDFASDSVVKVRQDIIAAHKQWGGANGGVVAENVVWNRQTGLMECRGYGDQYSGPVKGVDIRGNPSGFNTRIGGCLVTRDYYGPGSFRVVAKTAQRYGVCSALWTIHYEESYPGSDLWTSIAADGLHEQGSEEDGYYRVRNHEIDIEMPSALKLDPLGGENVSGWNAKFNTWQGELRNWDVPNNEGYKYDRFGNLDPMWSEVNDPSFWSEYQDTFMNTGINIQDDQYHEFRFDWYTNDPRVEFYVDGNLINTNYEYIPNIPGRFWVGLWFPSANLQWAGRGAPWVQETMLVKSIDIIPFPDEYVRNYTETYPNDVFRDIREQIIYKDLKDQLVG